MRDSQKWKKVQLRPAQQFHRRKEEEGDPDIGLPATYRDCQEGEEGNHQQPQQPEEGHPVQHRDGAIKERWSFSPPPTWVERPRRPLTRSVATRRQGDRERVQHRGDRIGR